jgi:prepilin-type N-terminal cleavage/methylation domain-containing protein
MKTKGFTLIELLIVVGILAILSVVVLLTLNPAQLLQQSRDATRISDLATLNSALSLYLADVASPDLDGAGNIGCGAHSSSTMSGLCTTGGRFTGSGSWAVTTSRASDGTGWIPVNFTLISSGSPLPQIPVDPVNTATYFYAYKPDNTALTWEMNANMESIRYRQGGAGDVESNDGGSDAAIYEVGSDPGLNL